MNKLFLFYYFLTRHDVTSQHQQGRHLKEDDYCLCNGPTSDPPTNFPEQDGTNLPRKTTDNKLILCFWQHFLSPYTPRHTDLTQCQRNCQKIKHLRCIIYSPSLGIGWWSTKMINYYVTKKASISTLNRIIYKGIYNYGDVNL